MFITQELFLNYFHIPLWLHHKCCLCHYIFIFFNLPEINMIINIHTESSYTLINSNISTNIVVNQYQKISENLAIDYILFFFTIPIFIITNAELLVIPFDIFIYKYIYCQTLVIYLGK